MMKIRSRGRGTGYSPWRGLLESVLGAVYVANWPARLWELVPGGLDVRTVNHTARLPATAGRSCRVAFVSDLHIGPTTPVSLLEAAFDAIRSAEPDVLLLGGDYVYLEAEPQSAAILERLVKSIAAPVKLAVLGNHDLWTQDGLVVTALEEGGAALLINRAVRLPEPWRDVAVIGLDDPWTGACDEAAALEGVDGAAYRIVLCHGPDGLLRLRGVHFDWFLCGHTHGGQIATPWGPLILPSGALCRRFPAGFAHFNGGHVYTSRGVGGVELPIRLFAPPEILVLDLERPRASEASVSTLSTG